MTRYQPIDAFRGFAIIGMVFFTLILKLSSDLPELLRHNVRNSIHFGDFILPMFLFTSGISLAYYLKKRENKEQSQFLKGVIVRFGMLAAIAILLSPFSARGFFEMDELMLNALLFLACASLSILCWKWLLIIVFFINTSYSILTQMGLMDAFQGHYLGGYPAAVYYLPVMLIGFLIGRAIISDGLYCKRNKVIIGTVAVFFFISWVFVPIDKLAVTPSFMMLSILLSVVIFMLIERLIRIIGKIGIMEYFGKKPLRYWVMMYVFFIIPLILYVEHFGKAFPLEFYWPLAIMMSICMILLLWLASHVYDLLEQKKLKGKKHC